MKLALVSAGVVFLSVGVVQSEPPATPAGKTEVQRAEPDIVSPEGFVPLFDGKDLDGWTTRQAVEGDWSVVDGVIDCNPRGEAKGDRNLWTKKEYGDFELLLDWRIKESPFNNPKARIILPDGTYKKDDSGNVITVTAPNTDSGVFLRGQHKSQVNIWCWPVGSGEVWGYRTDPNLSAEVHAGTTPKEKADQPLGEWNTFRIVMKGDRLTVTLNGRLIIDNAQLPGVPAKGPLALQLHPERKDGEWGASLIQFRNIRIKELTRISHTPPASRECSVALPGCAVPARTAAQLGRATLRERCPPRRCAAGGAAPCRLRRHECEKWRLAQNEPGQFRQCLAEAFAFCRHRSKSGRSQSVEQCVEIFHRRHIRQIALVVQEYHRHFRKTGNRRDLAQRVHILLQPLALRVRDEKNTVHVAHHALEDGEIGNPSRNRDRTALRAIIRDRNQIRRRKIETDDLVRTHRTHHEIGAHLHGQSRVKAPQHLRLARTRRPRHSEANLHFLRMVIDGRHEWMKQFLYAAADGPASSSATRSSRSRTPGTNPPESMTALRQTPPRRKIAMAESPR